MQPDDSLLAFTQYLSQRCPGYIKLMTSQTDEEFDEGLEYWLEQAVDYLEKNANHLSKADEEKISAFLIAFLTIPGLRAIQEAHSKGHVDITIETEIPSPSRRRLGEAKIYSGPAYHVQGLVQLITRYSTGRQRSGIVFEYVQKPKIKDLVIKIKNFMDTKRPCAQDGMSIDHHRIRWAFTTNHMHSSGELLKVLHINCNLYVSNG